MNFYSGTSLKQDKDGVSTDYGCCSSTDCWNGTHCVGGNSYYYVSPEMWKCSSGTWVEESCGPSDCGKDVTTSSGNTYHCDGASWDTSDWYPISSNEDSTTACCDTSTDCVLSSTCESLGATSCRDTSTELECSQSNLWTANSCGEAQEVGDNGDEPLDGGKVVPAGTCSSGSCSSSSDKLDSCDGDILTEWFLSGGSPDSKQYDCSDYIGCWLDSGTGRYNTSSCGTESGYGFCDVDDQSLSETNCANCGTWFSGKSDCCYEPSDDYVETGDAFKACDDGSPVTCTTCGQTPIFIGDTKHYCTSLGWSSSREYDDCEALCIDGTGYEWFSGTIQGGSGERCCDSTNDDFYNASTTCDNGNIKTCGVDLFCGQYFEIGTYDYYCDTTDNQFKPANSPTYPKTSGLDQTTACCDSGSDCVLSGSCINNGLDGQWNGDNYKCKQGTWKLASGENCTLHNQCYSGKCIEDFSGSTNYCSPSSPLKCPHSEGEVVSFYDTSQSLCDGSAFQQNCDSADGTQFWTQITCSNPSDSDGGNNPFEAGKVVPPSECEGTTCTSSEEKNDTCSSGILTEYWLDGGSDAYETYHCSDVFEGCWNGYYNTSSCESEGEMGYCEVVNQDLDNPDYISHCDACGFNTVGNICCGDDAQNEYYKMGELDGTSSCCNSPSYCVHQSSCMSETNEVDYEGQTFECTSSGDWSWKCNLTAALCSQTGDCCSGSCVSSYSGGSACCSSGSCWSGNSCDSPGTIKGNGEYRCYSGVWEQASQECQASQDSSYFVLNGVWVAPGEAKNDCPYACSHENVGGIWLSGTLEQGTPCCLSTSTGSYVKTSNDEAICYDSSWNYASQNIGNTLDYVGLDGDYLGTNDKTWLLCDSNNVGQEIDVDSTTFLCTDSGWANKVCSLQGDDYQETCEGCGGYWTGRSGTEKCCGDDPDDEFLISSNEICDGTNGLKVCGIETVCNISTMGESAYYCFDDAWSENELFKGTKLTQYGASSGCCSQNQCWNQGCFDTGYTSDGPLCSSGEWIECTEDKLCSSFDTSAGKFYCTDKGWSKQDETFCQGLSGVCSNSSCKLCGTDYSVGDKFEGYTCTSSGIFSSQGCLSNSDCFSEDECRSGVCESGSCVFENLDCGTPCSIGVCDGSGFCNATAGEGENCLCEGMCSQGFNCEKKVCSVPAGCGDGVCQTGDCSGCPEDCSLEECKEDGICSYYLGENCDNSGDCSCAGSYCNPFSELSDTWGCVASACGNTICEPGECSFCTSDCGVDECKGNGECNVILGETCDNSPDCVCRINVTTDVKPVLRVGEMQTIRVYVENDGNAPMVVDLDISAEGVEVGGGNQRIYLSPKEKKNIFLEVMPTKTGAKKLQVLAKSSDGSSVEAGELEVHVKEQTPWENFLTWFRNTPVYGLYESLDILFGIGAALYAFFKIFIPKKAQYRNYYGQAPRYYYGSNYHGPVTPQQGQQYRRGYYKF